MESPPQFAPPPPAPKRSNAVLIVVLVLLGICALCCVGGVVVFMNLMGKVKNTMGCVIHYTFARKALSDYAMAHGGKLPPAASWQDDIAPYYGKGKNGERVNNVAFLDFGDPSKDLGCAGEAGSPATGMAFNRDLAGKTVDEARKNPSSVVLFEVPQTGRNICLPFKPLSGQSPNKMMGQSRAWITVPVVGSMNVNPEPRSQDTQGFNGL